MCKRIGVYGRLKKQGLTDEEAYKQTNALCRATQDDLIYEAYHTRMRKKLP
jgi:transcriptional regulator of met regulon